MRKKERQKEREKNETSCFAWHHDDDDVGQIWGEIRTHAIGASTKNLNFQTFFWRDHLFNLPDGGFGNVVQVRKGIKLKVETFENISIYFLIYFVSFKTSCKNCLNQAEGKQR